MSLASIKAKLEEQNLFHSEFEWKEHPTVAGYDKKFKWSWMATQLNTFFVATDFGSTPIDVVDIESHLYAAFPFAEKNYSGWPRGLQSGLGVISILLSDTISEEAKAYCRGLKSGKKWAGFTIPVVIDSKTGEVFSFSSNPMWGAIYFPYFRRKIQELTQ